MSDTVTVGAPADKKLNFEKATTYTVNSVKFSAPQNSSAQTLSDGVKLNLTEGNEFTYKSMKFTAGNNDVSSSNSNDKKTSTAAIYSGDTTKAIELANNAQVSGEYKNHKFNATGKVKIGGKIFEVADDSSSTDIVFSDENNFKVSDKAIALDKDAVIKISGGKVTEIYNVPTDAKISGEGIASIKIKIKDEGKFTITQKEYQTANDKEVTFGTDKDSETESVSDLEGSVTGNFTHNDGFKIDDKKITTDDDKLKVTAKEEKLTEIDSLDNEKYLTADFKDGIKINPKDDSDSDSDSDADKYIIKATNSDNDVKVALDKDGKLSVESIAGGANVEKYGQAQKVITVKNDKEYSLQITDYSYTVKDDKDDDGITFELVDDDFKVRTLYEKGKVTRYKTDDKEKVIWTWSIPKDKWVREEEEKGPYEITVKEDKTLMLKGNGVLIDPYSDTVITKPESGKAVEDKNITVTTTAIEQTTTFINSSDETPNIFVKGDDSDDQIITALAEKASVQVDKRTFTLKSETATGTTFKLDATRNTLKIASDYKVIYGENYDDKTEVKLENDNNDIALSNCANVAAPAGKKIQFNGNSYYTVNDIRFDTTNGSKAETVAKGVKFDLSTGKFQYDSLTLSGTGTAQITQMDKDLITLTDGAIVTGGINKFKYYNRAFVFSGTVEIVGKKFVADTPTRGGLIYFQTARSTLNDDGTYTTEIITTPGFTVGTKYVNIQENVYDTVKIVNGEISSVEGVKNLAEISGDGSENISIVTDESGTFTIGGKTYVVIGDSDGVTFVTDSNGNVSEVNGLNGSVEGNFANGISVNGNEVKITGASSITVASDGTKITEILNVAGDLVTSSSGNYRKEVRVISAGGAAKLTTSANGTIIFNGKSFSTSAGKTFTLNSSGNVLEISNTSRNAAANVAEIYTVEENLGTITLSTTEGLEEVTGDFSEGLTVNGVVVKVTGSTNFVVKDDDENIYIETTGADTFNINGKTFTTHADKTIFKLDESGNVSEIVTDKYFLDEESYLIDGDFSDEIIFNGQKFCVTGTDDTTIFIKDETLISIELSENAVNVVESGGTKEILLSGKGDITVGGKTFSTSSNFAGTLQTNSAGVYSANKFVGTISGELSGLELAGVTIESDDNFSVTSDGTKITAIENLTDGTFSSDNLDGITINAAKIFLDSSEEAVVTVADGQLDISELVSGANSYNSGEEVDYTTKESGEFFIGENDFKVAGDDSVTFTADENGTVKEISNLAENASVKTAYGGKFIVNGTTLTAKNNATFVGTSDSARIINTSAEEILSAENASVISGKENVTLKGGDVIVVEDTSAKVNITASKGQDTIYTSGKNVDIDLKGGATKIYATGGRATVENYKATSSAGFITEYSDLNSAIDNGAISFRKGKLKIDSAVVDLGAGSKLINFYDAANDLQKVGFASDDAKLDASNETKSLILVGGNGSTIAGGKGHNQIRLEENSDSTIALNGKNTVENFNATFDGDKISISADSEFSFDGSNVSVKSGDTRALLENISADSGAARILTLINGKEIKTAIAQEGLIIAAGSDTADVYYGKKSGVDFTGFESSLTVDLSENFYGINCVTLGGGQNTLISSSQNETLTGSDGTTEFIFSKDSGRDVIKKFNFDADKINVGNETITAVNVNNSGGVRMEISGSATLTLDDAQGKNFKINNFVALVDKNITYNGEANYFVATSQNASLTVGEGAEIWLDGSHGKTFVGDIKTLDASTAEGKTSLAGNDLDNTIIAGKGDATLWGGNLGDDLLVGGAGKNTFFYTVGNGNDTIQGANNGDVVNLSQVTLEQIASTNITADALTLNFKDGGSLQVNGATDIIYQLADGSKFSANHEQSIWITK